MDHDPKTCSICAMDDDLKFDQKSRFHFHSTDLEDARPHFRLYPLVPEPMGR
jgi:hypothetical protein